ncbi:phosphoribosyl transferase domain-containing protein [Rhizobium gallicum]|uniref:Phosphoribosyl transferase domain-containing protein n=1 Tax=Rhizobium gallicum TaxID=56730 RepID=A0A1L5NNB5_9HYPH|nr:phosphoribosyl transferase domain-containing protein [Rhizobium gallicum]
MRAVLRHVRRSALSAGPRLLRHCCRWPPPIMSEMLVRRALHRATLWRSAGSAVSAEAIANPPPFDRLRSVAAHDHAVGDLAHGLKYRDRTDLAPMMAGWMLRASDGMIGACDVSVPIPLHRSRMLSRKFNQTAELARKARSFGGRAPWSSRF